MRAASVALVSIVVTSCSQGGGSARVQPAPSPGGSDGEEVVHIVREGEPPLRPLPFSLSPLEARPESARDMVELLYEAIPGEHLDRIAAYHGQSSEPSADPGAARPTYESLYLREIVNAAFDHWRHERNGSSLSREISCIGRRFVEQVGLQLAMMHIYSGRYGIIRFHSDLARANSRAEFISRRLFEVCETGH